MAHSIQVQMYSPDYREQTISLLAMLWTDKTETEYEKYFAWKYENYAWSGNPLIAIAVHRTRVVGVLGHMIQRYDIGGEAVSVCIPVDGIVLPGYRKYGVYSRLLEMGMKEIDGLSIENKIKFYFNSSSNYKSAPGLVNHGWRAMAPRNYLNYISIRNMFSKPNRSLLAQSWVDEEITLRDGLSLSVNSEISTEYFLALSGLQSAKIRALRDHDFYHWRYSFRESEYLFVVLRKNNSPLAVAIARIAPKGVISFEEYFYVQLKHFVSLLKGFEAVSGFKIARLFYLNLSKPEKRLFYRLGFWDERLLFRVLRKKERTPAYIRPLSDTSHEIVVNGIDITDITNWLFFKADIL